MATRRLTRWHVSWFDASAQHGPYASVTLHGQEHHLFRRFLVTESFRIPITPQNPRDQKASKEVVKEAIKTSSHKWVGRV